MWNGTGKFLAIINKLNSQNDELLAVHTLYYKFQSVTYEQLLTLALLINNNPADAHKIVSILTRCRKQLHNLIRR